MVSVNVTANDGQIVCAATGTTIDLQYVMAYTFGPPTSVIGKKAFCPTGYKVTGGGGNWNGGLIVSQAVGDNLWSAWGGAGTGGGLALFYVNAVCIK